MPLRGADDLLLMARAKRFRPITFTRFNMRYYPPLCLLLATGSAWLALAR